MAKVILHMTMSLDGFAAGPHDEMDWVFAYSGPDQMAVDTMNATGAVVLGKRTWDVSAANNQMPYGGSVKVPQFIVTHEPHAPVTEQGLEFTFVTDGLEKAVELAKAAAGEKNVSLLGASIDQQCLRAGLVDEIVIHLAPVLLGSGIRLFDNLGDKRIQLERLELGDSPQITDLRFRVL